MWSRYRTDLAALGATAALVAGCAGTLPVPDAPANEPQAEASRESGDPAESPQAPGTAITPVAVEVPPRAAADFARAVELMRAGNAGEAELEFRQLAAGYPQLAGPHVNLGILHRNAGRLDDAVEALRAAVARNPASAVAWNELGVALRMRGEFQDAAAAYERAIAADPGLPAAHRNLGVLRDLYLGDPQGALASLERYQALTGEERPVTGWIAELRQRIARPAAAPATSDAPPPGSPAPSKEGVE